MGNGKPARQRVAKGIRIAAPRGCQVFGQCHMTVHFGLYDMTAVVAGSGNWELTWPDRDGTTVEFDNDVEVELA